jgi:LuxR family maltose regulon positive regulatory protein
MSDTSNSKDKKLYYSSDLNHLVRRRTNKLFADASDNPVITVFAGAGCGKTRAVNDFLQQQKLPFFWVKISECDNSPLLFWENYTDVISLYDTDVADFYKELGFPDDSEKIKRVIKIRDNSPAIKHGFTVFDDLHLLKDTSVFNFINELINAQSSLKNAKTILIFRAMPPIRIKKLQISGFVSEINDSDLNFTETEVQNYFKQQNFSLSSEFSAREIHKDTGGWAFAVNLVARSLSRVPKYTGFVKLTLKPNIFEYMESENWNTLSERLKAFLLHLSLIEHVSAELVGILTDGDNDLLLELKEQSAFIRYDVYGGAYIIHSLYLEFLKSKQNLLSNEEKRETYKIAAAWCNQNNFMSDALRYYEKLCDYESIISIFWHLFEYTTNDSLVCIAGIVERAPKETIDNVSFFAVVHLFSLLYTNKTQEFLELADAYEQKFLSLPENNPLRNDTLGAIYCLQGILRFLMCTRENCFDFDLYCEKALKHWRDSPPAIIRKIVLPHGVWVSTLGSCETKALNEYTGTIERSVKHISLFYSGINGADDLYKGELRFYQNDTRTAEALLSKALEQGRRQGQYETVHRSLFYILRILVVQGCYAKIEPILNELELFLEEPGYLRRNYTYDVTLGWYYCAIRQTEMVPDWLKGGFERYNHAHFLENYSNQIKMRYHYLKRDYFPLLTYINEMKNRESILYGRVEMLATEACVYYQMKDRSASVAALEAAYRAAQPNNIIMPFIELGKDMRTLTTSFLRSYADINIPKRWLELVRNKSTFYAKNQSMFICELKSSEMTVNHTLSARELAVLSDLYHGFSQPEIAYKHSLSVNTVKMTIKRVYEKLKVSKISDLIRVAAEQKLI